MTPLPGSYATIAILLLPSPSISSLRRVSDSFAAGLDVLQNQIGYSFKSEYLLKRAMTHSSYSIDNYRPFSILGLHAVEVSASLRAVQADPNVSAKDLTARVTADTNAEGCAKDGLRLEIHKLVRVSPKTNASQTSVVCGAFRVIFGAVALDSGMVDSAGKAFQRVHGRRRKVAFSDH